MSEARLAVETSLPFAWRPLTEPLDAHTARGNRLLLRSINAAESSLLDAHQDRLHERLETKLDLALHWLGRTLFASVEVPAARLLRLESEELSWEDAEAPPASGSLVRLILFPNPGLAAPLELAGEIVATEGLRRRARLLDQSEEWQDEWTQWLFRLHRRTIQAGRKPP